MTFFINQTIAVLLIFIVASPSLVYSDQVQINLSNDISYDNISASCKSNTGKDLGTKLLGPGTNFTWTGDINVPGENEIWLCALQCTPLKGYYGNFTLFISKRDNTRCGQRCLWSAREDGIYLYIPAHFTYEFQFKWE